MQLYRVTIEQQSRRNIATTVAAFFWRKLDAPGHDSCRLIKLPRGWRLCGAAVFKSGNRACHFAYEVRANAAFHTRSAQVAGYLGRKAFDIRIECDARQHWRVNGVPIDAVAGCIDVDLGFTPATNLLVLRRLALAVGKTADAPAAYLAFPRMRLVKLSQRYERVSRTEYDYAAPSVGYAGRLEVSPLGAVRRYPRLFVLVK